MIEDFDKYLANNKTYISDFDITKHIVLDNESNYWYSAEYVDKMLKKQDKEIERLNNIINTMLDFNFFKEECPLNFGYTERCNEEKAQDVFSEDDYCEENCNDDYKKCWLKYFERLQELKGSDSNVKD